MPLMRSPDRTETVEVPMEEVRHYLSLGATLAAPVDANALVRSQGAAAYPQVETRPFRGGSSGAPDVPEADGGVPWWADPLNYLGPAVASRTLPLVRGAVGGAAGMLRGGAQAVERAVTPTLDIASESILRRTLGDKVYSRLEQLFEANAARKAASVPASEAEQAAALLQRATRGPAFEPTPAMWREGHRASMRQATGRIPVEEVRAAERMAPEAAKPVVAEAPKPPPGKIPVREHFRTKPKRPEPKLRLVEKPKLPEPVQKRIAASKGQEVEYFSKAKGTYVSIEDIPTSKLPAAINDMSNSKGAVGKRVLAALKDELQKRLARGGAGSTYASSSKGAVPIEGMNQKFVEQAYNKLARTGGDPEQMRALLDESLKRLQTTGIHVGQ